MNEKENEAPSSGRLSLEEELELDNEDGESLYRDEIQSLQRESDIHRLGNRMTFLFILVPTLLCAVFAFAYIDLRGRLKDTKSTGTQEVKALSENVLERVTSVLEEHKRLEQALGERLADLEKGVKTAQNKIEKERQDIKELGASKIDKKSLQSAIKKVSAEMTGKWTKLQKTLAQQQEAVDTLAKKLEKELDEGANAVATFQSDLRMQSEQVTTLAQTLEKSQRKALELDLGIRRLFDDRTAWNKEMEEVKKTAGDLQRRLALLADEVAWIEKKLSLKREKSEAPTPSQTNEEIPPTQENGGDTGAGETTPGGNSIVEQDISQ